MHARFLPDVLEHLNDADVETLSRICPYSTTVAAWPGLLQLPEPDGRFWPLPSLLLFNRLLRFPACAVRCPARPGLTAALAAALLAHIRAWAVDAQTSQSVAVCVHKSKKICEFVRTAFIGRTVEEALGHDNCFMYTDRRTNNTYVISMVRQHYPVDWPSRVNAVFIDKLEQFRREELQPAIERSIRAGALVRAVWTSPDVTRSSCFDLRENAWPFPVRE